MKDLLKVALVIALAFASTFVVMRLTGVLTEDGVRTFLSEAHTIHPGWFVALFKNEQRLEEVERAFGRNDLLVLFACQALPILPELSCCLAGIVRTPLRRFYFGYAVGVVPFAFIVAWAGSVSTLANPKPAILTTIAVSVSLLAVWTLLARKR